MERDHNTYYLGLTMAGAISAGAYTAGVIDVLLEALDRHNARYQAWKDAEARGEGDSDAFSDHPRHRVVLRVISGTSAGGVTAGLMVAGLIGARRDENETESGTDDLPPLEGLAIGPKGDGTYIAPHAPDIYRYEYKYILKPLHEIWIEKLDLWRPSDQQGFLSTGDLDEADQNGTPVVSALNSSHIDGVASTALEGISWSGGTYGFLAEDLDLFLTTTNLQGVPYKIGFPSGTGQGAVKNSHAMAQHSTVRHFRLTGLGIGASSSPWLEAWQDRGIALPLRKGETIDFEFAMPLNDRALSNEDLEALVPDAPWPRFRMAAIATGAFPVGLAPRVIRAEAQDLGVPDPNGDVTGGAWPINQMPTAQTRPVPALDDETFVSVERDTREERAEAQAHLQPAIYVAADGGVANNEPFELARYTLRQTIDGKPLDAFEPGHKYLASNPRDPEHSTATVLMIDPFPEGPVYSPLSLKKANALAAMIPAAAKLLPALINQARFKPGELLEATNGAVFSRSLISPSRGAHDGEDPKQLGAKAIASGSFGGFGGFFDRTFRAHDYMLGQRNMRSFLKRRLLISTRNPILGLGLPQSAKGDLVRLVQADKAFYDRPMPLPPWPRISQVALEPILEQAELRVQTVGATVLNYSQMSWFRKLILGGVWGGALWGLFSGIEKTVANALKTTVLAELIARDQHHEFAELVPPKKVGMSEDLQRKILVKLAETGSDPIPLALAPDAHAEAVKAGETPRDLLSVLLNEPEPTPESRAEKINNLKAFLGHRKIAPHLWKAPWRAEDDARYTLALLKPAKAWTHYFGALSDRLKGS
ncbi:MAG: hypothetical protein AAFV19_18195 [Pseudomonadota bacterium]